MLWKQNLYLREMFAAHMQKLQGHLKLVEYQNGDYIRSKQADTLVIFPLTVVFALIAHPPGASAAFICLFSSKNSVFGRRLDAPEDTPYVLDVVGAGYALKVAKHIFVQIIGQEVWSQIFVTIGSAWIIEAATINSSCNATHSSGLRVARMLSHLGDAFGSERMITLSHAKLGELLKIRREGVSEALASFRNDGLVKIHRGRIEIINRERLRRLSCSCYAASSSVSRRLWTQCSIKVPGRSM